MKSLCAAITAASLVASSAFAAAPLAPGKAAGLHQAQNEDNTWIWVVGIGVVAAGIAIAVSGNSNGTVNGGTTAPPTTTTTTTT